jgi:uncharacterized protein
MGDNNFIHLEKLMNEEVVRAITVALGQLIVHQRRIFSVVLHGGEPLLLGAGRLKFLLGSLRSVLSPKYPVGLQTNGILITKEILDICSTHQVSVAVSIDGPKHVHDRERLAHDGKGTFDRVMKGYQLLKSHRDAQFLNAGLLAVIDPSSEPKEVYEFFKSTGAPSVDFLYKDGNHDKLPPGKSSPTSLEYGSWMINLLGVYLNDPEPMPIRILDDMLKVLLGGMVTKEGLGLNNFGILVIDTDGTLMKNDTLKSVYNGADKFTHSINIRDVDLVSFLASTEFTSYRNAQKPVAAKCIKCPCLEICGGGMLLHRFRKNNGFDNPSIYCEDQLYLIERMRSAVRQIVYHESV